ncbi:MAG: class GN sortase [Xanthomonadales bacterium]|nr:class GN sortase [Xanthomonadales bacterium]
MPITHYLSQPAIARALPWPLALPSWQRGLRWAGLAVGLCMMFDGAWIQAKAQLAQFLIASAWASQVEQNTQAENRSAATALAISKPWPWADTWPVARLQFAQHDIDLFVLDGAHGSALAFGPGRLHGTADPGEAGVSVVGGHRDTHFRFLAEVAAGDRLSVTNQMGEVQEYQVFDMAVVDSRVTPLTAHAQDDELILVTCYPFDALQAGGPMRYVVRAEKMEASTQEYGS